MNQQTSPSRATPARGWKRWRRWLLGGALALAALALLWVAYQPRPLAVAVATVGIGLFEQAIEEDGRLRLRQRYTVVAPTAAQLQRPTLKVGDAVRAGDVVARLEPVAPQMIDARTRAVLQQRLGSAEAARRAAVAQEQGQQTALAQATLQAERAAQLARDNFISASARDQALLARQAAQQALDAALAQRSAAEFALAEARAALARAEPRAAGRGRDDTGVWALTSPVDGQVLKLHLDSAGPVAAGQALLELGDIRDIEAVIDVLSGEVHRIEPGAPVQLSLGGGAPALAGRVARIEPVAFTKISALGIEEQRVNVLVSLDEGAAARAQRLGDGWRVDARIVVSSQARALRVPGAALVRDGSRWQVLVVEGGKAQARAVQIQARNADWAWVAEGLREGEQVVLYPGSMVKDGMAVKGAVDAAGARP